MEADEKDIEVSINFIELIMNRQVLHLADASDVMQDASATFEIIGNIMEDPDFEQAAILIQRLNNTLMRTITEIHEHPLFQGDDKEAYLEKLAKEKANLEAKWAEVYPGIPCYVS